MISVIAVCSTVLGDGSFCSETSPELLTSCQMTSTASGLISRYQARRPGRRRAAGVACGAAAAPGVAAALDPGRA